MKRIIYAAIVTVLLCGCGGHSHDAVEEHNHVHIHGFTAYTGAMEFFMQHEGLVVGEKSCITLYVTELDNFKPTGHNNVAATMTVGENVQTANVAAQSAGVFHFDFVPGVAGDGVISFEIGDEKANFQIKVLAHSETHSHAEHAHSHSHSCDDHSHAEHAHSHSHSCEDHSHAEHAHSHSHSCEDHSHAEHAHSHSHSCEDDSHAEHAHSHSHSCEDHSHADHNHSHPVFGVPTDGKDGDVALTKEQSWKIDFATAVVGESNFGGVIKVAARVEPVPSNFTTIVATTSGKVQFAGNVVEGKDVVQGEPLFYLEGSDVTDNDAAVLFAEAESNYELAKADFERKSLLFAERIVSEREYQATEAAYRQAEARFNSMRRNFGGGKVTLKSSIGGFIATLLVENGDYVQPGTPLATVQRNGNVNIVAELPVRYAAQLQSIENVNIEVAGGRTFSLNELNGRLQAVGSAVNSCNMIPVTVSAESIEGTLPGSIVTLYIATDGDVHGGVAVPRTAIVEEMGNFFVFVQNSPVSFEKRAVEVGETDGISVRLLSGLSVGERVVTKGAVSLKLSQGAAALDPHAGHVH